MKLERRMLGPCGGNSVRLGDGTEIVVTEGIESALSYVQALGLPAYAALSGDRHQAPTATAVRPARHRLR